MLTVYLLFLELNIELQRDFHAILLLYSKVFHVRSVTQGDVIRADAKEIPKIFQVRYDTSMVGKALTIWSAQHWLCWFLCLQLLYAGEGEARKPDESPPEENQKPGTLIHKGHELVAISFHMPTTCEVCPKPLWHMFRPPAALECRRKSIFTGLYL
jgi:hypothetical protein